jgi:hypothetical protein
MQQALGMHALDFGAARQVSRADFLNYLCLRYCLARERIDVFSGANVACFSPCLADH